jgi:hypothetical protein
MLMLFTIVTSLIEKLCKHSKYILHTIQQDLKKLVSRLDDILNNILDTNYQQSEKQR